MPRRSTRFPHVRRHRLALLVVLAGAIVLIWWLIPHREAPREAALGFIDTADERAELERLLKEGRVRLLPRDEFDARLTPEQRRLSQRVTTGTTPR